MKELVHEQQLREIFQNVTEWLKFAEAKNVGLLTFDSALLFGLNQLNLTNQYIYYISIIFVTLSLITALVSLSPITTIIQSLKTDTEKKDINIHFFGDLRNLTILRFMQLYKEKTNNEIELTKYEEDLVCQILTNSRITWIKYKAFSFGIYILMTGLFICLFIYIKTIFFK